jgi:hypothetical protein
VGLFKQYARRGHFIEADGEIFGDRSLMPNAEHPIEHRLGWFWAMGFMFALGRHGDAAIVLLDERREIFVGLVYR